MDDTQGLGRPVPFIIVAISLGDQRGGPASDSGERDFVHLLGTAQSPAFVLQAAKRHDTCWSCSVLLPENDQLMTMLHGLDRLLADFEGLHPADHAKLLIHHGLLFKVPNAKGPVYIGSALRWAHTQLQRLPTELDRTASTEFARLLEARSDCELKFHALPEAHQRTGLLWVEWQDDAGASAPRPPYLADGALTDFLVHRLACHLGPIARMLVHTAGHMARNGRELIDLTAQEIDDPTAQADYRNEAMIFLHQTEDGGGKRVMERLTS